MTIVGKVCAQRPHRELVLVLFCALFEPIEETLELQFWRQHCRISHDLQ